MKTDLFFGSQLTLSGRFLNCSLELASVPVLQTLHNLLVVLFPLSGKRISMSGVAEKRIMEERKQWRIDHPPGFFAKFSKNKDDSQNMMVWETGIPGREGTPTNFEYLFSHWSILTCVNYFCVLHRRYRLGGCCLQPHHSFQQRIPFEGIMAYAISKVQTFALNHTTHYFVTLSFSRHNASLHLLSGIPTFTQMVLILSRHFAVSIHVL